MALHALSRELAEYRVGRGEQGASLLREVGVDEGPGQGVVLPGYEAAEVHLVPVPQGVVAGVGQEGAYRGQCADGLRKLPADPLQPGLVETPRDPVPRRLLEGDVQAPGAQRLSEVARLFQLDGQPADPGHLQPGRITGPPQDALVQEDLVQRADQCHPGQLGQALVQGEFGPGRQWFVGRVGAEHALVQLLGPAQQLSGVRARLGDLAEAAVRVVVRLPDLVQQRKIADVSVPPHEDRGEPQFVRHRRLGLAPEQIPQQLQISVRPVELRGPQGEPTPYGIPGHRVPAGGVARPQQGQIRAASGEHRFPQWWAWVFVQQPVGEALVLGEQQEVGFRAQKSRVQQGHQLDRGTLGKAQGGTELGPGLVEAAVLAHLLLGLRDPREDHLLAVQRRQVHEVEPAGQAEHHLERLLDTGADDSGPALGVGVEHRAVRAHEVRTARARARDDLYRSARGEADRLAMAVVGTAQVELEGERGQFGQARVLPQRSQRVIGHVTERNRRH